MTEAGIRVSELSFGSWVTFQHQPRLLQDILTKIDHIFVEQEEEDEE